jgi:hypothetical protein
MLNLHRLKYLKEHNPNDSLQYVADFILSKIQRDKSEFSNYTNDEDWSEFEQFMHKLNTSKQPRDLRLIRKMLREISDNEGDTQSNGDFEKSLIRRLKYGNV